VQIGGKGQFAVVSGHLESKESFDGFEKVNVEALEYINQRI
jgi:hypothetical protein